ncbi:uncharacterized protein LOC124673673 [Lolium rigidum]|uniref:uncharacterized protein LOC124673673 n=1 Tax=Lolium rigidum TaxID=89674 RepID=UPI001F5C3DEA|nr:uncharacterized protein LOC124673673 [Lolium rigidum]
MADSTLRPRKDLPSDLLTEIACRLPCLIDRLGMSRTCRDWWLAVKRSSPPRQLPWLLLPDPTTSPVNTGSVSFYCVLGKGNGDTHNLRIGEDTGNARFFGSYDGGWILLAHGQTDRHMLLNLHTDRRLFLPDHVYYVSPEGGAVLTPVSTTILVATFSSPPGQNTQCFGAAIIDSTWGVCRPQLAFWSMEVCGVRRPVAMGFMKSLCEPWSRPEDVIYHRGAFHFLTDAEHVVVYDIFELQEVEEGGPRGSTSVRARYLVESRGELLMVMRYAGNSPAWFPHTGGFQVYQATQLPTGASQVQLAWTELHSLDGRMLFVARGCSRSYEVADFPGSAFGEGIYFLDDRKSNDIEMVSLAAHAAPRRWYTCSDNGRCRLVVGEPRLQVFRRWFTNKEHSDYSPPIWCIP